MRVEMSLMIAEIEIDTPFYKCKVKAVCLNLIHICDKIAEFIDNHLFSAGIFIDVSKACDTIYHKIMIKKLEYVDKH